VEKNWSSRRFLEEFASKAWYGADQALADSSKQSMLD